MALHRSRTRAISEPLPLDESAQSECCSLNSFNVDLKTDTAEMIDLLLSHKVSQNVSQNVSQEDLKMKIQKGSAMIHCILVVHFDVTVGSAIEYMYPPINFHEKDRNQICFNAFPDTNSHQLKESSFSFRFKKENEEKFINGFAYFRQDADVGEKRGYNQRSVVILSYRSFPNLFMRLAQRLKPFFFERSRDEELTTGENLGNERENENENEHERKHERKLEHIFGLQNAIRKVYNEIGHLEEEPKKIEFLGKPVKIDYTEPFLIKDDGINAIFISNSFYDSFSTIIDQSWLLWELVLFGEPILIFGSDPSVCSTAVLSLTNLISPLKYMGEFHPYVTIQDKNFQEIFPRARTAEVKSDLSCFKKPDEGHAPIESKIVGVTNLHITESTKNWPNVIRLGNISEKKGPKLKQGLETTNHRHVLKDSKILKLTKLSNPMSKDLKDLLLKDHFQQLTLDFLQPFEEFYSTLISSSAIFDDLPRMKSIKPFKIDDFLKFLSKKYYIKIKLRSNLSNFYLKFIQSINFTNYISQIHKKTLKALKKEQASNLKKFELCRYCAGMTESQLIDLVLYYRGFNEDGLLDNNISYIVSLLSEEMRLSMTHIQ